MIWVQIIITYEDENMIPKLNSKCKFKLKLKDANCDKFTEEVENNMPAQYCNKNVNKLEKKLRKIITEAAKKHVGNCWEFQKYSEVSKKKIS